MVVDADRHLILVVGLCPESGSGIREVVAEAAGGADQSPDPTPSVANRRRSRRPGSWPGRHRGMDECGDSVLIEIIDVADADLLAVPGEPVEYLAVDRDSARH